MLHPVATATHRAQLRIGVRKAGKLRRFRSKLRPIGEHDVRLASRCGALLRFWGRWAQADARRRAILRPVPAPVPGTFFCNGVPLGEMARGEVRIAVTLACEECKRRNYQSNKSRRNSPDRIELRKFCRWCKRHTAHKETR